MPLSLHSTFLHLVQCNYSTSAKATWENWFNDWNHLSCWFINSKLLTNLPTETYMYFCIQKQESCYCILHFNSLKHHWLRAHIYTKWWLISKKKNKCQKHKLLEGSPRKLFRISTLLGFWVNLKNSYFLQNSAWVNSQRISWVALVGVDILWNCILSDCLICKIQPKLFDILITYVHVSKERKCCYYTLNFEFLHNTSKNHLKIWHKFCRSVSSVEMSVTGVVQTAKHAIIHLQLLQGLRPKSRPLYIAWQRLSRHYHSDTRCHACGWNSCSDRHSSHRHTRWQHSW